MPKKKKLRKPSTTKKRTSWDGSNLLHLPQREAMEGMLSDLFGGEKVSAVDQAQDIMYDAWEAPTRKRRVALAQKALEVSPHCPDAYVLLAEETAKSLEEAIELYRRGVKAGERILGKKAFEEDAGHFWGILETRPYMRARSGLAGCLWKAGQREEAVAHYQDLLRLNPNDNQGIRYALMPRLIELRRDEEAETLYKGYSDDPSAFWSYTKALLDFRKEGDSKAAHGSVRAALRGNRYVPSYLLGVMEIPLPLPEFFSYGDENEAILYADSNRRAWKVTWGALKWLEENLK
jgi:tetratricopeptide (TPR) repeat protein